MISKTEASIAQAKANFLAVLRHYELPEVDVLTTQTDRITVTAPDEMRAHLARLVAGGKMRCWNFVNNHGATADCGWRENVWRCSTQIIAHSTGIYEIDVDLYNPDYGLWPGLQHTFLEVWKPGKTNPYKVRKVLIKRDIWPELIEA